VRLAHGMLKLDATKGLRFHAAFTCFSHRPTVTEARAAVDLGRV
jgi:hypothetical protein